MYGMTECQANLFTRPDDPWEVILTTVGRACPGMEVAIFDATRTRPLADGEVGEVVSGDLGSIRDGNVTLHGRIKDVIIRGGHNIAPEAVEAQLTGHPAVADVAVVGVPDARLGERTCACVIPRGEVPSLEALVAYLKERGVGPHLWPEFLLAVRDFPRTPLGKVQRGKLRAEAIEAQQAGRLIGRPASGGDAR
jgi:non-ribosomal peptide synthetase component E (peptide arylation enzyme)